MPFDSLPNREEPKATFCLACKMPIAENQRSMSVWFRNDPHGLRGLTGKYHKVCAKPFVSLARVINVDWFRKF